MGLLLFYTLVFSQKKALDTGALRHWQKLETYGISPDGRFCFYIYGTNENKSFVIQSVDGKFKREFFNGSEPKFSADTKKIIFRTSNDRLNILDLLKKSLSSLDKVVSFQVFSKAKLSYLLYTNSEKLMIKDLNKSIIKEFDLPQKYLVNSQGTLVALKNANDALQIISLPDFKIKTISSVPQINNISFSPSGKALTFTSNKNGSTSIYFWTDSIGTAKEVISNSLSKIDKQYPIADQPINFSSDERGIFFNLKREKKLLVPHEDILTTPLVIYDYRDPFLKTERDLIEGREFYRVYFNLWNQKFTQIETENLALPPFNGFGTRPLSENRFVLLQNPVNEKNKFWDTTQRPFYQILDLQSNNLIKFIPPNQIPVAIPKISPSENFLVWMNEVDKDIYSYEIASGQLRNLTSSLAIPSDIYYQDQYLGVSPFKFNSEFSFISGSDECLISDRFDIWQVELSNKKAGLNLTRGYGRKGNVEFRLGAIVNRAGYGNISFSEKGLLKVILYDWENGNNGFAEIAHNTPSRFRILSNDPVLYFWGFTGKAIQKADKAEMYLLTKESAQNAPNLVVSPDLKTFNVLSNIHPESDYNWLTSELIKWPMPNGKMGRGILYKPENFNPNRKYPVLFHYYQKRSQELNKFWDVESYSMLRGNNIHIPEYVSAGYLVFVPDIVNEVPGEIAKTVVHTVESAAKYLIKTYPFVDERRLGLQGHSFGGYETNLIVAGSNLFAAANASSGVSNLVTHHGSKTFDRESEMFVEIGQPNMGLGVTPWNKPQVYIENSPLFRADKITTPLLINVGGRDGVVLPSFGFELFYALRRLKRPVWLLEYTNEGHLNSGFAAEDFALRQRQFFDHYLMDKPLPLWMNHDIQPK